MSRWRDLNYLMGLQLVHSCLKRGTLSERDLSVTNGNLRALHPLLVNFIIIRIEDQSLQTPCMVNRRQMCKIAIPPNSSHCSYRASPPPSLILIWHIVNLHARAPSFLCFNLSAAKDKTIFGCLCKCSSIFQKVDKCLHLGGLSSVPRFYPPRNSFT